jgi:hypothetical protein
LLFSAPFFCHVLQLPPFLFQVSITITQEHDVVTNQVSVARREAEGSGGHYTLHRILSFCLENNLSMFKVQTLNPINKSNFSRGPQLTTYKSLNLQVILNGYFSVTLSDFIGQGRLTLTRVVVFNFVK